MLQMIIWIWFRSRMFIILDFISNFHSACKLVCNLYSNSPCWEIYTLVHSRVIVESVFCNNSLIALILMIAINTSNKIAYFIDENQ